MKILQSFVLTLVLFVPEVEYAFEAGKVALQKPYRVYIAAHVPFTTRVTTVQKNLAKKITERLGARSFVVEHSPHITLLAYGDASKDELRGIKAAFNQVWREYKDAKTTKKLSRFYFKQGAQRLGFGTHAKYIGMDLEGEHTDVLKQLAINLDKTIRARPEVLAARPELARTPLIVKRLLRPHMTLGHLNTKVITNMDAAFDQIQDILDDTMPPAHACAGKTFSLPTMTLYSSTHGHINNPEVTHAL